MCFAVPQKRTVCSFYKAKTTNFNAFVLKTVNPTIVGCQPLWVMVITKHPTPDYHIVMIRYNQDFIILFIF